MDKELRNRILNLYVVTVTVDGLIQEMQKLDDDYFKNNWSIALTNLSYDLQNILADMNDAGFSVDYRNAMTFMSYVRVFDFLINKMSDNLVTYEEGIGSIRVIITNISRVSKPYVSHMCSRMEELNLAEFIPPNLLGLYSRTKEEGFEKWINVDMSNIFEHAFPEEDDIIDDIYLDEIRVEMEGIFGEEYDIADFESISTLLAEYVLREEEIDNLMLDF